MTRTLALAVAAPGIGILLAARGDSCSWIVLPLERLRYGETERSVLQSCSARCLGRPSA